MVEKFYSKTGKREILIERCKNKVVIFVDAYSGHTSQIFSHELAKKAGLKPLNYGCNILVENIVAFGPAYKLPFFGRKAVLQKLRNAAIELK